MSILSEFNNIPFILHQGRSRNLIIRELQRTNLDVNLAVNNLLSRDEEGEEDGDDSQGDYVPEVEFSFSSILSIQMCLRNPFCFFLYFNLCIVCIIVLNDFGWFEGKWKIWHHQKATFFIFWHPEITDFPLKLIYFRQLIYNLWGAGDFYQNVGNDFSMKYTPLKNA